MKWPSNEQWLFLCNILVSRWVNSAKNIDTYQPATILCIKYDEIGDMAACVHVFKLLKTKYPSAKIDVITKEYSAGLLQENPYINQVFTSINAWNKKYDFVIELRGNWKSLWRTFKYYPKVRLDRGLVRFKNKGNQVHESRTNFEIIEPILGDIPFQKPNIEVPEKYEFKITEFLAQNGLQKYAVVHASARRKLRQWQPSNFAQIADWLYLEKGIVPVFIGTTQEEQQIGEITSQMKSPFVCCTSGFELLDLAALMKKAALFLGNESGPLQIADAVGLQSVGLFGPGVKDVFYPQVENSVAIHHVLDCNPCDQIHCVRPDNPCINLISLVEVKEAIDAILLTPSKNQ